MSCSGEPVENGAGRKAVLGDPVETAAAIAGELGGLMP